MPVDIVINPELDPLALCADFQRRGRLQIPDFFVPETAAYLHRLLLDNQDWYLAYNEGAENYESSLQEFSALEPARKHQFMNRIYSRAQTQFQHLFYQYYITQAIELGEQPGHPMHRMQDFMNSETTLSFMAALTGQDDIRKADSYASWYAPGHFLTQHDDLHSSHDRIAALVFSMTPDWNANWGGHLAFFDEAGNIEEAFLPSFNTLNIFLIPQRHAVQLVAPFAGGRRTSFLSWLHR
jgi:Rps23 Pro-64 3,4-dihydroxylase Tpa1-like proline 4-hydroxylase